MQTALERRKSSLYTMQYCNKWKYSQQQSQRPQTNDKAEGCISYTEETSKSNKEVKPEKKTTVLVQIRTNNGHHSVTLQEYSGISNKILSVTFFKHPYLKI